MGGGFRAFLALACLGTVRAAPVTATSFFPSTYAVGVVPQTITFVQTLATALASGQKLVITPSTTLWAGPVAASSMCTVNTNIGNTATTTAGSAVLTITMSASLAGTVTIVCNANIAQNPPTVATYTGTVKTVDAGGSDIDTQATYVNIGTPYTFTGTTATSMIPSTYAQGAVPTTITFVQTLETALVSTDTIVITPSTTLWAGAVISTSMCTVIDGVNTNIGNTATTTAGSAVLTIEMSASLAAGTVTIVCSGTTNLGRNGASSGGTVTGTLYTQKTGGGEKIDGSLGNFGGPSYDFVTRPITGAVVTIDQDVQSLAPSRLAIAVTSFPTGMASTGTTKARTLTLTSNNNVFANAGTVTCTVTAGGGIGNPAFAATQAAASQKELTLTLSSGTLADSTATTIECIQDGSTAFFAGNPTTATTFELKTTDDYSSPTVRDDSTANPVTGYTPLAVTTVNTPVAATTLERGTTLTTSQLVFSFTTTRKMYSATGLPYAESGANSAADVVTITERNAVAVFTGSGTLSCAVTCAGATATNTVSKTTTALTITLTAPCAAGVFVATCTIASDAPFAVNPSSNTVIEYKATTTKDTGILDNIAAYKIHGLVVSQTEVSVFTSQARTLNFVTKDHNAGAPLFIRYVRVTGAETCAAGAPINGASAISLTRVSDDAGTAALTTTQVAEGTGADVPDLPDGVRVCFSDLVNADFRDLHASGGSVTPDFMDVFAKPTAFALTTDGVYTGAATTLAFTGTNLGASARATYPPVYIKLTTTACGAAGGTINNGIFALMIGTTGWTSSTGASYERLTTSASDVTANVCLQYYADTDGSFADLTTPDTLRVARAATVLSLDEDGVYQGSHITTLNFRTNDFATSASGGSVGLEINVKVVANGAASCGTGTQNFVTDTPTGALTRISHDYAKFDFSTTAAIDITYALCYALGDVTTDFGTFLFVGADTLVVKAAAAVSSLTEDGVYTGGHVTTLHFVTTNFFSASGTPAAELGYAVNFKVIPSGSTCGTTVGNGDKISGPATGGLLVRTADDTATYPFSTTKNAVDNEVVCYAIGTVGNNANAAGDANLGTFVALTTAARAFDVKTTPEVRSVDESGAITGLTTLLHFVTVDFLDSRTDALAGYGIRIKMVASTTACGAASGTGDALAASFGALTHFTHASGTFDFTPSTAASANNNVCYNLGDSTNFYVPLTTLDVLDVLAATQLTWTDNADMVNDLVAGHTPTSIVFSIGVTTALVSGDTITLTANAAVFIDSTTVSCMAPGVDALTAATAATAQTITLHAPGSGVSSGDKVFTCTGGLAANPAAGAVTFSAESTKSTIALTGQTGYTTTSSLGWTSATLDTIAGGALPTTITFIVTITDTIGTGESITLTASAAIWSSVPDSCTWAHDGAGSSAATNLGLTGNALSMQPPSAANAGTVATIVCTNGLAPLALPATTVTFSAVSSTSVVAITGQTGYTTTSALTWTAAAALARTGGAAEVAGNVADSIAFSIGVTDALAVGDTITFTASGAAVWAAATTPTCHIGSNSIALGVASSTTHLVLTATATVATGDKVFTCAGGLAANAGADTVITFDAVSTKSVTPTGAQTGYTIAAATALALNSVAPGRVAGSPLYSGNVPDTIAIDLTLPANGDLIAGQTITVTTDRAIWTTTGTSCVWGGTVYASTTSTTVLTITMPSNVAAAAQPIFTCTGGLAANPALATTTSFTAVSTASATVSGAQTYLTTSSLGWTSAALDTIAGGASPTTITFIVTITDTIGTGESITLTASAAIWSSVPDSCTWAHDGAGSSAATNLGLTGNALSMQPPSAANAGTVATIVCTNGLAPLALPATTVTFSAVSSTSVVAITGQTGYTTTSALTWTAAAALARTGGAAEVAGNVADSIAFSIGVTDALAVGDTITFTASGAAVWAAATTPTCHIGSNSIALGVASSTTHLVLTATATVATGDKVFTCAGGLAANAGADTVITFDAVSTKSVTPTGAQTGYTIAAATALALNSVAPGRVAGSPLYSGNVPDTIAIDLTLPANGDLIAGQTITVTTDRAIWTTTGTSCVWGGTVYASTTSTTVLTITMPSNVAAAAQPIFTCTGGLAANPALATTTSFTAVSTASATVSGAQTYLTTSSLGWTSVTLVGPSAGAAGATPEGITFVIVATDALTTAQTVTLTASSDIWVSGGGAPACTWSTGGVTTASTSTETLTGGNNVVTAAASTVAGATVTIECTGGMSVNGDAASTVTFNAESSTSTVALTGQTGYSTNGRLTWGATPTVSTNVEGHAPTWIVFSVGVSDALVDGDTITMTADQNVFVASSTFSCVAPGVGASTATTPTATAFVIHAPSGGLATGTNVFTCTGTLAANLASGTPTTFTAVSTKSLTASVPSGAYATTGATALTWTADTTVSTTAVGATPSHIGSYTNAAIRVHTAI